MAKFKIVLGDWSGDGHSQKEDFIVEIPDKFTVEQMSANYKTNSDAWGFNPTTFCDGYEDYCLRADFYSLLTDNGFVHEEEEYEDEDFAEGGDKSISIKMMLEISMFFISYGIPDFTWEIANSDIQTLFGPSGVIESSFVGYGLFGT